MEQHALAVRECKNQLQQFSAQFNEFIKNLNDQQQLIERSTENLKNVKLGSYYSCPVTDETLYFTAEKLAKEILQAQCLFESSFAINYKNIGQHPFAVNDKPTDQEEPQFLQWLHKISSLQQLFSKQKLFSSSFEQDKIELHEIQSHVEVALGHLDTLHNGLTNFYGILQTAKNEAPDVPYGENYANVFNLKWMELSQFALLQQTIMDFKINIYQKFTLMIDVQPRSVIMKIDKKPQCAARGARETTTRTEISVKLTNFLEQMNVQKLTAKIGLINESAAQAILKSSCFREPTEYQAEIYSCPPSAANAHSHPVSNFDKYIMTEMSLQNTMEQDQSTNGMRYEAHVSNISVIKVGTGNGRNRKGSGCGENPVVKDKFYFLITAQLPLLQGDAPVIAWTMSTPVIIRTHSTHIEGSLATASYNRHFSENTEIPFQLRTSASIAEIKDVLQLHFKEWTSYTDKGKQSSLTLNELHLQFLIDMLLEHICSHLHCTKDELTSIPLEYFYYEKLNDRKFSYWSWFHKAVSILKRKYVRELWLQDYLIGFIGKNEAFTLLNQNGMTVGNFILRFSQSVEEELSILFVSNNGVFIHPMRIDKTSDSTFKTTFLENIYKHYWTGAELKEAFLTVYPKIPKEVAFPRDVGRPRGGPYVHEVNLVNVQ